PRDNAGRTPAACGCALQQWGPVPDRDALRHQLPGPGWERVGRNLGRIGWTYPVVNTDAMRRFKQRYADLRRQRDATPAAKIEALDKRNTRRLKARNPAAAQPHEAKQAARIFRRIAAYMAAVGRHRARTTRSK
ncbi:MAG: hypothetical protein ACK5ZV_11885, partial [bacterium]